MQPTSEFLKEATFLVDASSYVFRAYYAIQRPLQAPDGTPTHATFGFLQMVQALIDAHGLSHCVLVWDRGGKGIRHEIFPAYKANRSAPPEDLSIQIENARKATDLLGLPQLDAEGYEADDILATLVRKYPTSPFVIVTADKDLLQLVGPNVWCYDTMKQKWSNAPEAEEKFGVPPEKIVEVQALSGDSVDNVPGVPGVGPKTASDLIRTFGTVEEVLKVAQERVAAGADGAFKDKLKGKCLESVAANVDKARISRELVALRTDAPVPPSLDDMSPRPPEGATFIEWARHLGFTKIAERILEKRDAAMAGTGVPKAVSAPPSTFSAASVPGEAPEPQSALEGGAALAKVMGNAPTFRTEQVKDLAAFRALLKKHERAPLLAFDTETFSLDHFQSANLVGLSLSFEDELGYYVPLRHVGADGANLDPKATLEALQTYLTARAADPNFALVFQNAKFDLHALANDGFRVPAKLRIDDTMVASFVLNPAGSHGLDALATKYLGGYSTMSFETVTEGVENFAEVPLEKATFYAAEDAVVCRKLWARLREELQRERLWPVYEIMDRPLIGILFAMEREGVALDADALRELSDEFHKELAAFEKRAIEYLKESGLEVSPDLNLHSPKQMAVILYEKLGLPVLKRKKTGPSTDVSVLVELAEVHPFPEILLEVREVAKLLSTYVDALPALVKATTGRVHTDFSQVVAATGRLASSNPNLQNIPIKTRRGREIRKAFRAKDGHVLIGIDYSQLELRLLAHISRDPELVKAFEQDVDVHRRTAALVLGKPETEVTEDDRRMAKAVNYGIAYGQTAFGLSKALKIPRATAQTFIDAYFATYPGIRRYMDSAVKEAREAGSVKTLTGRRRLLPEIHSRNGALRQFAERMAINTPLQGLAADLMKMGMLRVDAWLHDEHLKTRLLLQVHDEIVLEAPLDEVAKVQKHLTEILEDRTLLSDFKVPPFSVRMKVEVGVGSSWAELA